MNLTALRTAILGLLALTGPAMALAQPACGVGLASPTTPEGASGLMVGTQAPPGIHVLLLATDMSKPSMVDSCGQSVPQWHFHGYPSLTVTTWVTSKKILGGDYAAFAVWTPVGFQDLKIGSQDTSLIAPADPVISPFNLGWHQKRFDETVGVGWSIPVANYERGRLLNGSAGQATTLVHGGGTVYLTADRAWNVSVLNHFEYHHQRTNEDYTLGPEYHFEGGIARTIMRSGLPFMTVGPIGYGHWMLAGSHGPDLPWDSHIRPRGFGFGPQALVHVPKCGFDLNFIWMHDVGGRSFPQGNNYNVAIIKHFKTGSERKHD